MCVRTAISLPDDTFERATGRAHELGISRSEFFARAPQRYLEVLDRQTLTQEIDDALHAAGTNAGYAGCWGSEQEPLGSWHAACR